jgi:GH18 family chitinase
MVSLQKKKKTLVISYFSLGWTREWSDGQEVPYAYSGSNWVGYDDTESIARKVRHLFFFRNSFCILYLIRRNM